MFVASQAASLDRPMKRISRIANLSTKCGGKGRKADLNMEIYSKHVPGMELSEHDLSEKRMAKLFGKDLAKIGLLWTGFKNSWMDLSVIEWMKMTESSESKARELLRI